MKEAKAIKVKVQVKEEAKVKAGEYVTKPINWVGNKKVKGRPIQPRTIKAVLDLFNVKKVLKYKNSYYYMDLNLGGDGLHVKLTPVENLKDLEKMELVGWYNYADEHRKKKIPVYNICRSIREEVAEENKINDPNAIQFLINIK